jgi:hypothetical protein
VCQCTNKQAILPVIAAEKPFFLEGPAGMNLEETKEIVHQIHGEPARKIHPDNAKDTQDLSHFIFVSHFFLLQIKELVQGRSIGRVLSSSCMLGFLLSLESVYLNPLRLQ